MKKILIYLLVLLGTRKIKSGKYQDYDVTIKNKYSSDKKTETVEGIVLIIDK